MHKLWLLLLISLPALACVPAPRVDPAAADAAIARGLSYLASVRTPDGAYKDQYLQYVYPGEELSCPLADCNLTYRTLDAYFNLRFIQQRFWEFGPLAADVARADTIMQSLLPVWRAGRLYNIQQPKMIDPDGFALDTYCILGYLYADESMARVAKDSLLGWEWLPDGFYNGPSAFRTIADESWCTRLLIVAGADANLVRFLALKGVRETAELARNGATPVGESMAYYHTLLALHDLNDPRDQDTIRDYHRQLARLAKHDALWNDTITLANILDALATTNSTQEGDMATFAAEILKRQAPSGAWYAALGDTRDHGQVFATFRSVLALHAYRQRKAA